MKEKIPADKDFFPIGEVKKKGKVVSMDFYVLHEGQEYVGIAGTKDYIEDLTREKVRLAKEKLLSEDEYQIDPILEVEDFEDLQLIKKRFLEWPYPFLTPQIKREGK